MSDAQSRVSGAYSAWLGKSVILRVVAGELRTTLPCTVIGESDTTVRIRLRGVTIPEVWDVDIYKKMILGVEPAGMHRLHLDL
jgi:hypothetical protein